MRLDLFPGVCGLNNTEIKRAADLLLKTNMTVAVAESCTGGLLGAALTELPGSSAYFLGGVLAYDDRVKTGLLGVPQGTIEAHGAVSAETAIAMASHARKLLGADIGVSVTGIAGPTGATSGKPVGTTFIGLSVENNEEVHRFCWSGDRAANRSESVIAALDVLTEYLAKHVVMPRNDDRIELE